MTTTLDRINQLSAERSTLYRQATNGRSGDPTVRRRVQEINAQTEALWERRRVERAGRLEGIDQLIDREYQRLYGRDYEDAVAPVRVEEDEAASLAA